MVGIHRFDRTHGNRGWRHVRGNSWRSLRAPRQPSCSGRALPGYCAGLRFRVELVCIALLSFSGWTRHRRLVRFGAMYIAEIAPASWRGRLVGLFQFNVVAGILLAYLSNYLVGLHQFGLDTDWRWKLGVSALPAALFFLMLFTIPRSPRWLVKKRRIDEAREVLTPDRRAELRTGTARDRGVD
jgi:MFS family permease